MARRLICLCNFIEEREIKSVIRRGAVSARDIQFQTRAGTSCGKCLPMIDEIIEIHKNEKPKGQQQKLDFGS